MTSVIQRVPHSAHNVYGGRRTHRSTAVVHPPKHAKAISSLQQTQSKSAEKPYQNSRIEVNTTHKRNTKTNRK